MGQLMRIAIAAALALNFAACARTSTQTLMPTEALEVAIGKSIGDPTTCVLIAERASGKVVYTYGQAFNCLRGLPACDRPGTLSAQGALAFADSLDGRHASCNSVLDGSRQVGWTEGRVTSRANRDLIYSAVMEGQQTLPGEEMGARLQGVFARVGL